MQNNTSVFISKHKGRGVKANVGFIKDELIERNDVIVYHPLPNGHELLHWSMKWNSKKDCIALGNINLLNHSSKPNAYVEEDYENNKKLLFAKRAIRAGEEITVFYKCKLWFKEL